MNSSQDESPTPGSKSKQERIRDNQRRSRARRQDYVIELEKRLRECHTLCRDADIQKSAYLDLQRETACLRTLLGLLGVSPKLIDSFIHQNTASNKQRADSGPEMRQLKPKLPLSTVSTSFSGLNPDPAVLPLRSLSRSPISHSGFASTTITGSNPQLHNSASPYSTDTTSSVPDTTDAESYQDFDWIFNQLP